jgi:hypothetical protein
LGERLSVLEAELKGLRGTLSALAQFGGLALGLVAITFGWNAISERQSLRTLEREIKTEVRASLGLVADEPEIAISTLAGAALDGSVVEPEIEEAEGLRIFTPIIISNRGKGWTGPAALKIYTTSAIPQKDSSTDEPTFDFEDTWVGSSEDTGLNSIPGGFSYTFHLAIYPSGDSPKIAAGRHPCLLKIYYGRGKVARANFTLWIKETAEPQG